MVKLEEKDGRCRVVITGESNVTTNWHDNPDDAVVEAKGAALSLGLTEAAEQVEALSIQS